MKRSLLFFFTAIALLCFGLYFLHPLAPLLAVLSLLVQWPLITRIMRASLHKSYAQRVVARLQAYEETGDAQVLLKEEVAESQGMGYQYWSSHSRSLCSLNQAVALAALGQAEAAQKQLALVETAKLEEEHTARYEKVAQQVKKELETISTGKQQ